MRKNWSKNEDCFLKKIVTQVGINDWTSVANKLKQRYEQIERTGKQCRERWYNHLDPNVNKNVWSYEEELLLFQSHRELGNRWKQISSRLKGRTDNNIKNHFYSTLRRSLRRLNKIVGQKNSTLHMREIKPSVLTIILNFIYDHQQATNENGGQFINELKDLPQLIFQFAEFKPVKGNMDHSLKESYKRKIQTIFNLIETFKQSYYNQKNDKKKGDEEEGLLSLSPTHPDQQISAPEIKQSDKTNSLFTSQQKQEEANQCAQSSKWESNSKERSIGNDKNSFQAQGTLNMMDLQQPSPLTYIQEQNPFSELVVIGKHWSPKKQDLQHQQLYIDQILEINYE